VPPLSAVGPKNTAEPRVYSVPPGSTTPVFWYAAIAVFLVGRGSRTFADRPERLACTVSKRCCAENTAEPPLCSVSPCSTTLAFWDYGLAVFRSWR
jgi:hypothetical protein